MFRAKNFSVVFEAMNFHRPKRERRISRTSSQLSFNVVWRMVWKPLLLLFTRSCTAKVVVFRLSKRVPDTIPLNQFCLISPTWLTHPPPIWTFTGLSKWQLPQLVPKTTVTHFYHAPHPQHITIPCLSPAPLPLFSFIRRCLGLEVYCQILRTISSASPSAPHDSYE